MAIKNLTPHAINIIVGGPTFGTEEVVTIQPEPVPARLAATTALDKVDNASGYYIPITKTVFGEPTGLPDPVPGTLLIVSQLVKSALPNRQDLVVPAQVVRDSQGRIMGCRSLGI